MLQMLGVGGGLLSKRHFLLTICHLAISGGLHRVAPSLFGPPAMEGFRTGGVPYSRIVWARRRDGAIAAGLAAALAALLAKAAFYLRG